MGYDSTNYCTRGIKKRLQQMEQSYYLRESETSHMWCCIGGPYDWRLAADGLAARGAADGMQALIEMAVSTAGGKPAVIIAHSMVRS